MSEPTFRVAAIEGRHRGGPITSWEQYAVWLEQLVAHLQLHGADGGLVGKMRNFETVALESEYRALPRSRQRPAQRAASKEQRRR